MLHLKSLAVIVAGFVVASTSATAPCAKWNSDGSCAAADGDASVLLQSKVAMEEVTIETVQEKEENAEAVRARLIVEEDLSSSHHSHYRKDSSEDADPSYTEMAKQCDAEGAKIAKGNQQGSTFRCERGWCISSKGRCNGVKNCWDDSDEQGCPEAHAKERPECLAASIALNMYQHLGFAVGDGAPSGLVKSKTYVASTTSGDTDKAELWTKDGACWLSFMGSDHSEGDYPNNMNYQPKEEWGIQGLHSGVVAELKPLIDEMDFSEIRGICTGGKLTLTGHSLGGGLAQMFSLAINKVDDPLNAKLTVSSLYTFGAMAISANNAGNDKAADGCFPGAQFWYAERHGSTYTTDVVALPLVGGQHTHIPTKSTKVFVFKDTAPETYACGQPLPESQSLMMAVGHDAWLPPHMNYYEWLGC